MGREHVRQRSVVVRGGHYGGVLHRADVMDLVVEVGPGVRSRVGRHFRRLELAHVLHSGRGGGRRSSTRSYVSASLSCLLALGGSKQEVFIGRARSSRSELEVAGTQRLFIRPTLSDPQRRSAAT